MNKNELFIHLCNRNLADDCVSQDTENTFADAVIKSGLEVPIKTAMIPH